MSAPPDFVTPDRSTVLVIGSDFGTDVVDRAAWSTERHVGQIGTGLLPTQPRNNDYCGNQFGSVIGLIPFYNHRFGTLRQEFHAQIDRLAAYNYLGSVIESKSWRQSDQTGTTPSSSIVSSGGYFFERQKSASDNWSSDNLPETLPKPVVPDTVPDSTAMIRWLSGKKIYPPNTGWTVRFTLPRKRITLTGLDNLITMYFGGPTPLYPFGYLGGQFALKIYGNGRAALFEFDGLTPPVGWALRGWVRWCAPLATFGDISALSVSVVPMMNDTLAIIGNTYKTTYNEQGTIFDAWFNALSTRKVDIEGDVWKDVPCQTGHTHLAYMTGAGNVRFDIRDDARHRLHISPVFYPPSGFVYDAPITVPYDLPTGTPMKVRVVRFLPPGSSLGYSVISAKTNVPVAVNAYGEFLTEPNNRAYYLKFNFIPTPDQLQSPQLLNYELSIPRSIATPIVTPLEIKPRKLSMTGDGIQPDEKNASLELKDPPNKAEVLINRGRISSSILIRQKSTGTVITELMRGETARPAAQLVGHTGQQCGHDNWRNYSDVKIIGPWARLVDQVFIGFENFNIDPDGATGIDGKPLPWRVTDIIKFLLINAGWNINQIIVPDISVRLWNSPNLAKTDYAVTTGRDYASIIQKLAREFLGAYLIFDENAANGGSTGCWRLIFTPPTGSLLSLWSFYTRRDLVTTTPKLRVASVAAGANACWIRDGSLHQDLEPPEFNYVSVSTAGGFFPGQTAMGYQNFMWNPDSLYNPNSPDYLEGRFVPIHVVDPYLGGGGDPQSCQSAVDLMCFRLYDFGAHARFHVRWRAPLVLITDETDPYQYAPQRRALRINDLVKLGPPGDTSIVLLRKVDPDYDNDRHQEAEYSGIIW